MNEEEFKALMARINKEAGAQIAKEVEEAIEKLQLSENYAAKEQIEALENAIGKTEKLAQEAKADVAIVVEGFQGKANSEVKSFDQQIREQLEANKEVLKGIKGNKANAVVLTIKAPAEQVTGNVTLPSATPAAYSYQDATGVVPASEIVPVMLQNMDDAQTDEAAIRWVEEIGMEGDMEFVNEGEMKPLMDLDYAIRYSEPKKVAGKIKVSEEALTDIPFLANEINRKLRQRHDLKLQDGVLNGDGTGSNLTGITTFASAFAAGGLAAAVDNAQNYDALAAAYNQILVASDGNYLPNLGFIHPTQAMLMQLTKDTQGRYVVPPFATPNGNIVYNMRMIPTTKIPATHFLVGDFQKAHVRRYVDFEIRIGYGTNAAGESDFERNMVTILGESRLHFYVAEIEKKAFVYDQFSVAKTALETV